MKRSLNLKSKISNRYPISGRAFTLIEMIVALGIFSVVAVVALGALVKIISANKKAQTLQTSITNLNFALETMSRDMRVGTSYHCDSSSEFDPTSYSYQGQTLVAKGCKANSAANSWVALAFVSTATASDGIGGICNRAYAYRLVSNGSNWSLQKATQGGCSTSITDTVNVSGGFYDIIDSNVTITGYYINVIAGASVSYPRAVIRISGYAGTKEKEKTFFDVQTTVAARTQ